MCGINGFNFRNEGLINKMNKLTKHRGPDDDGVFLNKHWSLGHNRLSIIDLSPGGHQPMFSIDKKLSIVFNGEIYNYLELKRDLIDKGYSFVSQSDTEVILYAYREWGKDCVAKFNGIFAFAILNIETDELFLARDHLGVKPLYYYYKNNRFIFSSEAKGIFAHSDISTSLNVDALNIYFRLLYIPSSLTIWENIYKLEPGHLAILNNNQLKIEQFWNFSNQPIIDNKNFLLEEVKYLVKDSIRGQLMSDRPLGVFLSGGIDSTIIAGVVSEMSNKVNTFSVGYEFTEESGKYNNDMIIARKTAQYFNTDHHELILQAKDIVNNFERAIWHMDEPVSNHIQTVNLLLAEYAAKKVKVVLGGDGSDELFGGYERYYYSYLIDLWQKLPKVIRNKIPIKFFLYNLNKSDVYQKISSVPSSERYLEFFGQKEKDISDFLRPQYNRNYFLSEWLKQKYFSSPITDFTRQFMRVDIKTWLPEESLLRSDKMSMAVGLEERVPFLDWRLVELADRIPIKYKLGKKGINIFNSGYNYHGKIILREAMKKYLPDYVLKQNKWGWFSPSSKWMRNGPLKLFVEDVLSSNYCAATNDIIDFKAVNRIYNDHLQKKSYNLNIIWSLLTFQVWYRQFINNKNINN